jgi:rRNA maturation protein Nop10
VLCEKCAELYARQFKNCPTCNQPVFNNNPSRFSDDASRQAQQNNYEYPRYENNNPINPYGNNADAQPYNHERPASGKNPIMLIGIACICVIVFIVLLVLRIKMNKC